MSKKLIFAILVIVIIASPFIFLTRRSVASDEAAGVLVVANDNSPLSCRIAGYYMQKRGIPAGNLVSIYVPDSSLSPDNETISVPDYLDKIQQPIRKYLEEHELSDRIKYIVLTKGIPIKLPNHDGACGQSVDSMLAAWDLSKQTMIRMGTGDPPPAAAINPYWHSKEPFSHSNYGGYLVTRLDGYTEKDVISLIDRALAKLSKPYNILLDASRTQSKEAVGRQPIDLLLPNGTVNRNFKLDYGDFDADLTKASEVIKGRPGLNVILDQKRIFADSKAPLTIYFSWGSNSHEYFSEKTYHSLKFAPRSLVETAVSTSGRTFLPTEGGQSLIADLIAQGATGAKGYVTEPYLYAMASPTVLVDYYTSGRNLAESYYAASRFLAWKDIVIGDPLCRLAAGK